MKTLIKNRHGFTFGVIAALMMVMPNINAQNYSSVKAQSEIEVKGTSNLHDWDVKAENFTAKAEIAKTNDQPEIKKFDFEVEAESLKSGKSGMDKNTYSALKTNSHKKITFKYLGTNSIRKANGNNYDVVIRGTLNIAGTAKEVRITGQLTDTGNGYTVKGAVPIDMTDFNVTPPTALMGTIKTGKEVTVNYHLTLK